ncbi:hypothetical protein EG829_01260 [bacterium]|nr:hypothetical protein [bacterium]
MGIPEDIDLFERSLKELIIKYEQYFLGLEKREPLKLLDLVERLSRRYTSAAVSNTMLLFKYNSIKSRLVSYRQYWNRTNRLIEEGKYSRDRFKMEMHQAEAQPTAEKTSDSDMDRFYSQYLEACRSCNIPTKAITREMVTATLEKHRAVIKDKYRCAEVEFRVLVEDGKPRIKARPK